MNKWFVISFISCTLVADPVGFVELKPPFSLMNEPFFFSFTTAEHDIVLFLGFIVFEQMPPCQPTITQWIDGSWRWLCWSKQLWLCKFCNHIWIIIIIIVPVESIILNGHHCIHMQNVSFHCTSWLVHSIINKSNWSILYAIWIESLRLFSFAVSVLLTKYVFFSYSCCGVGDTLNVCYIISVCRYVFCADYISFYQGTRTMVST